MKMTNDKYSMANAQSGRLIGNWELKIGYWLLAFAILHLPSSLLAQTRSAVQVAGLAAPGALIEIEVILAKPAKKKK